MILLNKKSHIHLKWLQTTFEQMFAWCNFGVNSSEQRTVAITATSSGGLRVGGGICTPGALMLVRTQRSALLDAPVVEKA